MQHKAESESDPVARSILESSAEPTQLAWGCPRVTHREPDRSTLSPKHLEVLEATERLTSAKCSTCPNFYLRLPWVHEAIAVRRWRDKGAIRERCGWPSVSMVAAIDAIDASDSARQRDDFERDKRDREARAEEAKRAREQ